MGNAEQAPK